MSASAKVHNSLLFSPWSIGSLRLENRIVIPPMCVYSATDGQMGAFHHMHVGSMCTSGAGLVILEATGVVPEGRITPRCCGIWDDKTAAAMKAVLDEVREYSNTPVALQLAHAGRKASHGVPFEPATAHTQLAPGSPEGGWASVAPSAIAFTEGELPPHEMTKEDIARAVEAFGAAARRAAAIGIDAIELHMAHGYLCHEFLSDWSNTRTDEYGGSLENRMRFALEVFAAARAAFPADKPVWVRISATDWTRESGQAKGWDLEQSIELCRRLKALGCALIHVSSGGNADIQTVPVSAGYQLPFAARIRQEVDIPTIGVGLITTGGEAEVALASGAADAIAIGRQILYNPHWPFEAAHDLGCRVTMAARQYHRCEPHPKSNIYDF